MRKDGNYIVALSPMMADGFDDVKEFAESEMPDDIIRVDDEQAVVIVSEAGYRRFEKSDKGLPHGVLADLYEFDEQAGGETTSVSLTPNAADAIIGEEDAAEDADGDDGFEDDADAEDGDGQMSLQDMLDMLKTKKMSAASEPDDGGDEVDADSSVAQNDRTLPAADAVVPQVAQDSIEAADAASQYLIKKTEASQEMRDYVKAMTLDSAPALIPDGDTLKSKLVVDVKESDDDPTLMKLMKQQVRMSLESVLSLIRKDKRVVNENDIDDEIEKLKSEAASITDVKDFDNEIASLNSRIARFNEHISQLLNAYTDEVDAATAAAAEEFRARYMEEHPDYTAERINSYVISSYPSIKEAIKASDVSRMSALNGLLDDNVDASGIRKSILSAINFVNLSESAKTTLSEMSAVVAREEAVRVAPQPIVQAPAAQEMQVEPVVESAAPAVLEPADEVVAAPVEGNGGQIGVLLDADEDDAIEPTPILDVADVDDNFDEPSLEVGGQEDDEPEAEAVPESDAAGNELIDDDIADDANADDDGDGDDAFIDDGVDETIIIDLDEMAVADDGDNDDVVDESDFTGITAPIDDLDEGDEIADNEPADAGFDVDDEPKKGGIAKKVIAGIAAAAVVAGLGFGAFSILSRSGNGENDAQPPAAVEQRADSQANSGQADDNAASTPQGMADDAEQKLSDEEKKMRAEMKRLFTSDMELQLSINGSPAAGSITSFSDDGAVVTLETGEQVTLSWSQLKEYADAYPELFARESEESLPELESSDAAVEDGAVAEAEAEAEADADVEAGNEGDGAVETPSEGDGAVDEVSRG